MSITTRPTSTAADIDVFPTNLFNYRHASIACLDKSTIMRMSIIFIQNFIHKIAVLENIVVSVHMTLADVCKHCSMHHL